MVDQPKPITMQDVRLYAGEGDLTPNVVLAGVNAALRARADAAIRTMRADNERLRSLLSDAAAMMRMSGWAEAADYSPDDEFAIDCTTMVRRIDEAVNDDL